MQLLPTSIKERKFDLANKVNNIAVSNLAQISKDNNIKLIHISTDYVFDGLKGIPYNEMDTPNPKTIYGKTKLNGELEMQQISPKKFYHFTYVLAVLKY